MPFPSTTRELTAEDVSEFVSKRLYDIVHMNLQNTRNRVFVLTFKSASLLFAHLDKYQDNTSFRNAFESIHSFTLDEAKQKGFGKTGKKTLLACDTTVNQFCVIIASHPDDNPLKIYIHSTSLMTAST